MWLPTKFIGVLALILCGWGIFNLIQAKRTNADTRALVVGIALGAFAWLARYPMLGVFFGFRGNSYEDWVHFTQVLCIVLFGILAYDTLFILADIREGRRLKEEMAEQEALKRRMEYERKRHQTGTELPS